MAYTPKSNTDHKESVRVAASVSTSITVAPASIDGLALVSGDRVLLTNQGTPSKNGIYVFEGAGIPMPRALDSDEAREMTSGMEVSVEEGSTHADTKWFLSTPDPISVDVTALTFSRLIPQEHASSHIRAGSDALDGDVIDITYNPSNSTPTTSPGEVTNVNELTAHLAGIDNALDKVLNPPLYSAYRGAAFINTSSWNSISWDTEAADVKFNIAPSSSIVIPEAGEYLVIFQMAFTNTPTAATTPTWNAIRVLKSGSEVARDTALGVHGAAAGGYLRVATINTYAASATIVCERRIDSQGSTNQTGIPGAVHTWIRVVKISNL